MSARDLPLFDTLPAEGDPPASAPSVEEDLPPSARAAAAVDPALADDPAEVTLRGEHDPDADPRMLRAERIAEACRQARDADDRATAGRCVLGLARLLRPGCPDFARALHRAEAALALCRVNPRRGFAELRETVARIAGSDAAAEAHEPEATNQGGRT